MTRSVKILIIDDDATLRRLLRLNLSRAGYSVVEAASGEEGLRAAYEERPDLVLLDIMMPRVDGWEVCARLRQLCDVPILMVSARGLPRHKVKGLRLGADDYVTKPFDMTELLLRITAILRRAQSRPANDIEFSDGYLNLRLGEGVAIREAQPISLTRLEVRLLACLLRRQGRPVSSTTILREVWGAEYREETHYVKNYIRRLRQKLEKDPNNPRYILTERGFGYKFVARTE